MNHQSSQDPQKTAFARECVVFCSLDDSKINPVQNVHRFYVKTQSAVPENSSTNQRKLSINNQSYQTTWLQLTSTKPQPVIAMPTREQPNAFHFQSHKRQKTEQLWHRMPFSYTHCSLLRSLSVWWLATIGCYGGTNATNYGSRDQLPRRKGIAAMKAATHPSFDGAVCRSNFSTYFCIL